MSVGITRDTLVEDLRLTGLTTVGWGWLAEEKKTKTKRESAKMNLPTTAVTKKVFCNTWCCSWTLIWHTWKGADQVKSIKHVVLFFSSTPVYMLDESCFDFTFTFHLPIVKDSLAEVRFSLNNTTHCPNKMQSNLVLDLKICNTEVKERD